MINAPVRLVNQIVDNLDVSKVFDTYRGGSTSSYHPRMMLKLVIYAYLNNIYSCRKIEKQNLENIHLCFARSASITCGFRACKCLTIIQLTTFVQLEQIEEGIAQDNQPDDEPPTPIDSGELKRRIAEVNHKLNEYRKNARKLLTSEEGILHRKRRSIEPESVFGQTKANKQYNRFRHSGLDKVKMDFGIFAVAFNIGKLYNKTQNVSKNQGNSPFFEENRLGYVVWMITNTKNNDRFNWNHKICKPAA